VVGTKKKETKKRRRRDEIENIPENEIPLMAN